MSAMQGLQAMRSSQTAMAEEALRGLIDKDRAHFALKIMMEINDPDAVAALRFAQQRIGETADQLVRQAFDRECG